MNLFKMFSFRNANNAEEFQRDQRSPRSDPNHPDHFKRYWTKPNVDWSKVLTIRVDKTCVFVVREEGEELVATRGDNRTALGYANAVSNNRNQIQVIDCL